MTCNNCERVEQELQSLKSFISGWFETFARRFDDQDEKLTVLMDAVSGVQIENDENSARFTGETTKCRKFTDSKADSSVEDEEDVKNVILFFNDSLNEINAKKDKKSSNDVEENRSNSGIAIDTSDDNEIYPEQDSPIQLINNSTATACADNSYQQNLLVDRGSDFFVYRNAGDNQFHPNSSGNQNRCIPPTSGNNDRDDIMSAITVECLPPSSSLQDLSCFIESDLSNTILDAAGFRRPPIIGPRADLPCSSSSSNSVYGPPQNYREAQFPSVFKSIHPRPMPFSMFHRSINAHKRYSSSSTKPKLLSGTSQRNHVPNFTSPESHILPDQTSKDNICTICSRCFGSIKALNRHKYVKHSGDRVLKFACKYCDKQYSWSECLHRHIATAHKISQN